MSGKNAECDTTENNTHFKEPEKEFESKLESESKAEIERPVDCKAKPAVEFESNPESDTSESNTQSDEEFEAQAEYESTTEFESESEFESYFEREFGSEIKTEIGQESEIDDVKEKVADAIINFFKVKRPKRFIDMENDETDLISNEESEFRLILLLISMCLILCIGASILLIHYVLLTIWSQSTISFYKTEQKLTLTWKPKMAIIDAEGTGLLVMYKMTKNFTLTQDWILKLPSPKSKSNHFSNNFLKYRNYYGFTDKNQLYIPYGDEYRNMIVIDSNKTHRIVPKSKLNHGYVWDTSSVRVGNYFWIFGGQDHLNQENGCAYRPIQRTILWSIKKNRWFSGPILPQPITEGCGLALNRTHAQLLVSLHDDTCLQSWIFNFKTWFWIFENDCFYEISIADEWLKLSCAQQFDKNFQRKTYLMIQIHNLNGFLNHMLLLQENGLQKIEHYDQYIGITNHLTLFTMQGKIFIMILMEGNNLGIFSYRPTSNTWKLEEIIDSFPRNSTHESKYLVLPLQ